MERLERITQNPGVMGGKPCIRGMRVTVGMLVGQIAGGRSFEDLLHWLSEMVSIIPVFSYLTLLMNKTDFNKFILLHINNF